MISAEFLDQQFRSIFADYLPKERPIDPPEPRETSLSKAVETLKQSLNNETIKSPYWDDHALHFRDELDNMLLDKLAMAVARKKKRFAFKLLTRALNRAYVEQAQLNLSLGFIDE